MGNFYIPTTKVQASVLKPRTPQGFVPLFRTKNAPNNSLKMASVNSGTSNAGYVFAVGLGGINGAFFNTLTQAGQDCNAYQQIHENLYQSAGSANTAAQTQFNATAPLIFSLMLKPNAAANLVSYDGIVFIDVFNPNQLPNKKAANCAMIYLVPPLRSNYATDTLFLAAIQTAAATITAALELYNTQYATTNAALPVIPCIRTCLFSGGIYSGGVPQDKVALSILAGLQESLQGTTSISCIEFENSFDTSTNQYVFRSIQSKLSSTPYLI